MTALYVSKNEACQDAVSFMHKVVACDKFINVENNLNIIMNEYKKRDTDETFLIVYENQELYAKSTQLFFARRKINVIIANVINDILYVIKESEII